MLKMSMFAFPDYIKNVCSSEIYPTWPENAIRANIYAQISLALNRVYTEWYPSQGYNFQITNSTQYDQKYVKGRNIFENISRIVDDIFNVYVSRIGSRGPFFTEYCDGRQVSCSGLKQWGTVDLANQGYTPLGILKYYYGDNIELLETNNIQDIPQSYPGTPLRLGSQGTYVQILQAKLNRIRRNYPLIGSITEDGVFGTATENAVKTFQSIFNLAQDGIVGKATWYKISYIYVAVTKLAELGAENENLPSNAGSYPGNVLKEGSTGLGVSIIQFYLSTVNMFYQTVPAVDIDGIYGPETANAVRTFQRQFNLTQDGIVGKATWDKLYKIYLELVVQLPGSHDQLPVLSRYTAAAGRFRSGRQHAAGLVELYCRLRSRYSEGCLRRNFRCGNAECSSGLPAELWPDRRRHRRAGHMEPAVRSFNADCHWDSPRINILAHRYGLGSSGANVLQTHAVSQSDRQYLYQYPSRSNRRNFWKCHSQRGGSLPTAVWPDRRRYYRSANLEPDCPGL